MNTLGRFLAAAALPVSISLFASAAVSRAADATADSNGFHIPFAGVNIDFEFPQLDFTDGRERVKPTSVALDGSTATLDYPNGGQAEFTLAADHIAFRFLKTPGNLKNYRFELHMPLSLSTRKTGWAINGKTGGFPAEFSGNEKLYQGNAGDFRLDTDGAPSLVFLFPENFAWTELQDFRKWNWGIYGLSVITPFNADKRIHTIPFGPDAKALPGIRSRAESAFFAKADGQRDHSGTQQSAPSLKTSLSGYGLEFDVGSMGHFALAYPRLDIASEGRSKPIETQVSGNTATLKYKDGGELVVTLEDGKRLRFAFRSVPAGYRNAFYEMFIPGNFNQGGTWTVDDDRSGSFPLEKAPRGKVVQANASRFSFSDANHATLAFAFPKGTWFELQDNREWGWGIFEALFNVASGHQNGWAFEFSLDASAFAVQKIVDRFGQVPRDFPGKISSEDELKADLAADAEYYKSLDFPGKFAAVRMDLVTKLGATVATSGAASGLDRFGGLAGFGSALGLKKTGFFHVEQIDLNGAKRWLLVDPEGNPFFHLGICGFDPSDDYTDITGRSSAFEWLPPHDGPFAAAWKDRPGDWWNSRAVSFYVANVVRKYGRYDREEHNARLIRRARAAGFNSIGAFSPVHSTAREASFPYVNFLSTGDAPALNGVRGMIDPFDPRTAPAVEKAMAGRASSAADPLLIGYFLANEQGLEDIPRAVPRNGADCAAKKELVRRLEAKYKTIDAFNAAWGLSETGFDALVPKGLAVSTKAAFADVQDFTADLLEAYYALIETAFRKVDPNHMLIGSRWQPGTANSEALCRAAGRHLDIVSINYYASGIDRAFLQRIHEWTGGRPQFWSEFYYTSARESNAGPSGHDLATQRERGRAYRNYVEGAASLGYVVGIEWFTLIDQASTGRFFEGMNGERNNTGLFSATDRPYRDLIDEMLAAHLDLYPVWFGAAQPYLFDDPRFNASTVQASRTVSAGHPVAPIVLDDTQVGYPLRPPERIGPDRLVLGNAANGLEASFTLAWDAEKLYLLASITDSTPMRNKNSGQWLWNGDGIELFLGHEDLDKGGPMLFSDRQILLGGAQSGAFFVPNVPKQPSIETAVSRNADGKGYTIEAAIPWSALDDYRPKEGDTLLFDIAIDDAPEGGDRRAQLMWNGSARNSSDRSAWGRLSLVP